MKRIAILGSTGSIGQNVLKVAHHLQDRVQVEAISAYSNIDLLEIQAHQFRPRLIAVYDEEKALTLKKRLPGFEVVAGMDGLLAVATCQEATMLISSMSGTAGLRPTIAAIKAGKDIGLANKEVLVSGGHLIMQLVKEKQVQLIPIDSEHSAIFQCLNGEKIESVRRLILTASGGPFRNWSDEQLQKVTVADALKHPTWAMGAKVTIDCSTLMNKGLEVIEAHWLFNISLDKIEVIIHPQSLIHSLVEFNDLSMLAQMSEPTMIIPIQYALTYPERIAGMLKPFDFTQHGVLEFYRPDQKFKCLNLAYEALRIGGTLPCFMNAANEVLVERFLKKEMGWNEIGINLEKLMECHDVQPAHSLETILAVDLSARQEASICKATSYL